MKFGRKILMASLAIIVMIMISSVANAQQQGYGNQGGASHGIPSGSWGTSGAVSSSRSTRVAPGAPGEWSPKAKPQTNAASPPQGPRSAQDIVKDINGRNYTAPVKPAVRVEDTVKESRNLGASDAQGSSAPKGIPSGSWGTSGAVSSSRSTRVAPGAPGEWSPKTKPVVEPTPQPAAKPVAQPTAQSAPQSAPRNLGANQQNKPTREGKPAGTPTTSSSSGPSGAQGNSKPVKPAAGTSTAFNPKAKPAAQAVANKPAKNKGKPTSQPIVQPVAQPCT